ncbi:hypothetical protein [Flavobacterium sp. H122]|uniref:hypothetical protein n=1 Tax=Flavobacterium sp. H122 TaxID=2529860 RepID=UPI0010AA1361|nr:hypothetical protein [Flavobacterium sp. H122]
MKTIISNWHLMRFIRLAFGIFLIFQAFETRQWIFLGFAAFFLFQALFNQGCGINNCEIPKNIKKDE